MVYQDCSSHLDSSKNMAARGRGLFSLYIYLEKIKKSSCQKPLDRFLYNLAGMFLWWPSTKFVQAVMIRYMAVRGWSLFSLYSYIENFKNLLVRNHWTDFYITWQKCSFGDPLPRLFKPFGFTKKHGRQGAGLIFPIYLYRNF